MFQSSFSFKRIYIVATLAMLIASANAFSIVKPDGGVDLNPVIMGENAKISWDSSNYEGNIDIYLWNYYAGEKQLIASNVNYTDCNYSWFVPSSLTPGDMYRIQIIERAAPYYSEYSSTYFTIYPVQPKALSSNEATGSGLNEVKLYPNPSSNELKMVSVSEVKTVIIRNTAGAEVLRVNNVNSKSASIKLPELSNGTYFIESILGNNQAVRDKIVITK